MLTAYVTFNEVRSPDRIAAPPRAPDPTRSAPFNEVRSPDRIAARPSPSTQASAIVLQRSPVARPDSCMYEQIQLMVIRDLQRSPVARPDSCTGVYNAEVLDAMPSTKSGRQTG